MSWWASSEKCPSEQGGQVVFALVDVNNFYASCEQLWEPKLRNRPVVVLSNNDGCVVARSKEAKAISVPMGAPWFKLRELAKQHRIIALSSNYELYASMSNRVVDVLRDFAPELEVYSIDLSAPGYCCVSFEKEVVDWCCD